MALIGARSILKCGQMISESLLFNSRSIAISKIKFNTAEESKKSESGAPPTISEDKGNEELDKLNKQITELSEKNSELLDKYKRSLADGENLRQRLTKQISEAKIYGIHGFCKDLLDVADVLNKATETVPKDEIKDSNPHLKSLYEGLVMTEAQLKSVFKRHGLEPVNPLNEKFNPNFHEALFQQVLAPGCGKLGTKVLDPCSGVVRKPLPEEVEGKEPGTVVVVSKIGYKLHERVLRPALVGVSK